MEIKTIVKKDTAKQVTLSVTIAGLVISIGTGQFRIWKDEYTLDGSPTYTVTLGDKNETLLIYLMKNKSDGKVSIIVDEVADGDLPLSMTDDPDHTYLWQLASLRIPANSTDLSGASLTIIHSDTKTPSSKKG